MNKKILSIAVAIVMLLSLMPMSVLAAAPTTPASILGYSIGEVSIGISGAGAENWDDAEPFVLVLTPEQATDAGAVVTPTAGGASVTYDYTETNVEPTSFGPWVETTLADGSFVWALVDGATSDTIYKFQILYAYGEEDVDDGSTLKGEGYFKAPIIQVSVPLNLHFGLDPFEMTDPQKIPESQIAGVDYKFANKSNVAVQVALEFDAVKEAAVELLPTDTVKQDDSSYKAKDAYMAILAAWKADDKNFAGLAYDTTKTGTLIPLNYDATPEVPDAALSFLLEASDGTSVASGTGGIASFTLYGKLNPFADWKTNDLSLVAEYTLNAFGSTAYGNLEGDLIPLNIMPSGPAVPVYTVAGFIDGGTTKLNIDTKISISKGSISAPKTIDFFNDGKNIASMTIGANSVKGTVSITDNVITWVPPVALGYNTDGEYTVTLTLADSAQEYTFTIDIGA
jgi:hypothetical protein